MSCSAKRLDGLGRTSEAIAEFQTAAKISPGEPNVHFGLGYLYWKTQQYDEARKEFERELALDPAMPSHWLISATSNGRTTIPTPLFPF